MIVAIVITLALLLTAIVWMPTLILLAFLQAPLLFDFMATDKHRSFSPLLCALLWDIGVCGILQAVFSLLAIFVVSSIATLHIAYLVCLIIAL
jgi:hypothetical protein